ncbi:S9 family peptidase [Bacteroides sp. OttesenSCG-928-E20]|nr:S9 family peptidase [Bacteroides sp. OttesenSCG-928-N06]MDL2299091.1 S9 family peptidase [Bacteroides sp. OttesenSCG-928-E20]MDL2304138.1 S9 family peptidase [Bacteroides sp. OttesenSCG-928-D19]
MTARKTLLFISMALLAMTAKAQIVGDWKGKLSIQGFELELVFHIAQTDGALATTLDIPAQGATGIPTEETKFDNNTLSITAAALQMTYEGTLNGDEITGNFAQAGNTLPLNLVRFESKLPGDISLPSSEEDLEALAAYDKGNYKYKVEDYFSRPKASSFQLSPDGKFMSYREKDENNKRHVYVKNTATGETTRIIEEKEELIRGYGWINEERLVYLMDQGGNENYHIYAVNVDGSNAMDLTPFDGVRAMIVNMLKEQKDYIIVSLNKNNKQVFEPYKLNVVNGELVQLFANPDPANPIQGYEFDKDGELRAYSQLVNGVETNFYYKDLATGEFKLAVNTKWYDTFSILGFNYASANRDEAYVVTNLESDKMQIALYDFKQNKVVKEVFANPDYDVSSMSRSRKRNYEIDYFAYTGQKYTVVPVSSFYKDLTARMQKEFGNKECHIVDSDDDENNFLFIVQSEKLYGTYYQYDARTKKFTLLYDLMPQLKEEDMAEMRPISFKSRDGLTIHGYITLPKAALEGKKVPMIVNPHGGPQGIRDEWGFNPEVQLFASRGYATLQVNFRISGGYGKEFLTAGFKQVGRKAMDDVEDGVRYAIAQGWADPSKIAIYGASHGGYATLMGLIKTPDLYACGVDYVGVSNIFTFFESMPEYWKPMRDMLKEIWYDVDDPQEAEIARQASPVFHMDKITKPLFVVQGANDPRVNINESDQIVSALRARNIAVPYMVKYNEGHGFAHEENSMQMYKCTLGFFARSFYGQ